MNFDFEEWEEQDEESRKVKFRGKTFDLGYEAAMMLTRLMDQGKKKVDAIKEVLEHYYIEYPAIYESKQGFEIVPILRGFTEIRELYNLVYPLGGFICGGYVRWMVSPRRDVTTASDVDVYCRNDDTFERISEELTKKYGLQIRHENEVSLTFIISDKYFRACPPIQLIKPIREGRIVSSGSVRDILENFDFTVIRGALVTRDEALVDADFMHDESFRILRIKNIHCPISSTLRFCKYCEKGYWAPPMQITKLFIDWDNRSKEYKDRIIGYLKMAEEQEGLNEEEIKELEGLLRVD